jgi:hypothetical protein
MVNLYPYLTWGFFPSNHNKDLKNINWSFFFIHELIKIPETLAVADPAILAKAQLI